MGTAWKHATGTETRRLIRNWHRSESHLYSPQGHVLTATSSTGAGCYGIECWWSRSRRKRGKPIDLPIERNVQQCTPGVETRAASPKSGARSVPRSCWPSWPTWIEHSGLARVLWICWSQGQRVWSNRALLVARLAWGLVSGVCWSQGWRAVGAREHVLRNSVLLATSGREWPRKRHRRQRGYSDSDARWSFHDGRQQTRSPSP